MRIKIFLTLIIMTLLLSACGKKGPVRPLTKAAVEQPVAAPQENSEKPEEQPN